MALGVVDQQLSRVSRQILRVCPEIAELEERVLRYNYPIGDHKNLPEPYQLLITSEMKCTYLLAIFVKLVSVPWVFLH